jgi:hypothetical protein
MHSTTLLEAERLAPFMRQFAAIYENRPIRKNGGGTHSYGLFVLWHVLRELNPKRVIESGVWRGQSTWTIRTALPEAAITAIEPNLDGITCRLAGVTYTKADFLELAYNLQDTVVYFDDHQDAFPRLRACLGRGARAILFDDNYPSQRGSRHRSISAILNQRQAGGGFQFPAEREWLETHLAMCHVFPPPFDYGQPITEELERIELPSLFGRFDANKHTDLAVFDEDMPYYRWPTLITFRSKGGP